MAGRGERTGDAHDEREVADQAVRHPEDHRPQRPRLARPMPSLAAPRSRPARPRRRWPSRRDGRFCAPAASTARAAAVTALVGCPPRRVAFGQALPDLGVLALVRRDRLDLGRDLAGVDLLLVALEGLDQVAHRVRTEHAGEDDDRSGSAGAARPAAGRSPRARAACRAQISAWRRSLPAIVRNAAARCGVAVSIPASASYRTIASRSSFRFVEALLDVSIGAIHDR